MSGKLVIVTGAAQGQGAAEAGLLKAQGADVIGLDLSQPDAPIDGVDYRAHDVADPQAWASLATELRDERRTVHGLVNNAGVTHRGRLPDVTAEDMARVMAINVTGPVLGIQTISPLMTDGGAIVNVCSIAATTGHYPPAYTASKWALRGVSRAASNELGHLRIRVNAIMPGVIATPMADTANPALTQLLVEDIPLGRRGTAQDIAPLVAFLLSDDAAWISGAEIAIDGGQAAHGGMKRLADAARAAATPTPANTTRAARNPLHNNQPLR